ncbi:DUF1489 family protein [Parvularcula dongshanensis]|uniref:DUF1489 family protein n=1 Tax=Parvularcula dongshanensis TaxID=1173995 RepID=A0A840I3E6_9PROT|nr:DUF1489 domain-containing protein [Parvularcula dongshanensis]MBB4659526.1 hypothetical protein [Parvularcula dongshanensis]
MTVHLMKVAVGCPDVQTLQSRQRRFAKSGGGIAHTTRMWPKRAEEILAGGSLYWAVAKSLCVRQEILGLEAVTVDGTPKCRIKLDAALVPVRAMPRRPFQGWRYLETSDAPPDLPKGRSADEAALDAMLLELGLM